MKKFYLSKTNPLIFLTAILFLSGFVIVLAKTTVAPIEDSANLSNLVPILDNTSSLTAFNYCNTNVIASSSLVQKCCVNDDSQCFSACNITNDNDCVVKQKLEQTHQYLLANKSPLGYTPAPNESDLQPKTEVNRIIPGSQAIGYLNLYKSTRRYTYLKEAKDRLDYLANINQTNPLNMWKGDSFDGFLGYAFLLGYESSRKQAYKDIGMSVANRCLGYHDLLNWGMMCAMNLGEAYKLTGNQAYLDEARAIVQRTSFFQNDDGSFPHQITERNTGRNRGYTAWIGFELATYGRYDNNLGSLIDLSKTVSLLEFLTKETGEPIYDYYCPETNPSIPCSSLATSCESRDAFSCQSRISGCMWDSDEEVCTGTPKTCSAFTNNTSCSSNGCSWHLDGEAWKCDKLIAFYDEQAPDYETKGGTGELVAESVVFHRTGKMQTKQKVLNFLFSLQNSDYSFQPKWGYPSPPSVYSAWEVPVVVTSDVFFQLSELLQK